MITVEQCSPDHAWGGGSWYVAALACDECKAKYIIYDEEHGKKPSLVLRENFEEKQKATAAWHAKIKEIEALPAFAALKVQLDELLAKQKFATQRYAILAKAGLTSGSLSTYRKSSSYWWSGSQAMRTMEALNVHDTEIAAKSKELEVIWTESRKIPNSIATGINGLAK